jgi:hypothetical protein
MRVHLHTTSNKPHVVLTTTQGNDVFRLIERNGLDPHAFHWDETRAFTQRPYPADLLLYWPAGKPQAPEVFFAFGRDRLACSPGSERLYEEWRASEWRDETLPYVALWLSNVRRESGPSLWESFPLERLGAVPEGRFNPQEHAVLLTRLHELEQRLTALESLTPEQKNLVRNEVRRIADAAQRLDRPEWLRFALGCMLTVVVASTIPQTVGASLMRWAVSAFHGMVAGTVRYIPEERRPRPRLSLR